MAIAFDAATNIGSTAGTTHTFNHTVTGTNPYLVVPPSSLSNGSLDAVTGVTFNGVSMSQLLGATQVGAFAWVGYLYGLAGPSTGTNSVVITRNTSTGTTYGSAASYTGVQQASSVDVSGNASGTAPPIIQSLTTTVDNAWLISANWNVDASPTAVTNATVRVNNNSPGAIFDFGPKTPVGSLTMTTTFVGTRDWLSKMVALKPDVSSVVNSNFLAFM